MAIDPTSVKKLPKDEFERAVLTDIDITQAILQQYSQLLQFAFERIANLGSPSTTARIIDRLFFSIKRFGVSDGKRIIIDLPLTYSDIALAVGTTRETVNRLMRKLEKDKIIEIHNHVITVNSPEKLSQLSEVS